MRTLSFHKEDAWFSQLGTDRDNAEQIIVIAGLGIWMAGKTQSPTKEKEKKKRGRTCIYKQLCIVVY